MSDGPPSARDVEDDHLLRQLALAHRRGDALAASHLTAALLGSYWTFIRNIVRGRILGVADPEHDAEEIAGVVTRKLVGALQNKQSFGKPFSRVVLDNIGWAIKDYWREPARRDESDPHDLSELPPQQRAPRPLPSETEQLRDLNERLAGLSAKDREIVLDRLLVGLSPVEIATRRGTSRAACDAAFSRAVRRLRESAAMRDVRDRLKRSDKQA
jgi:RNA polymerase sigma-70 factor (ECF subfamily)